MSTPATPTVDAPLSLAEYEAMVDQMQPISAEEAAQAEAILQEQAAAVPQPPEQTEPQSAVGPAATEQSAEEPAPTESPSGLANNWRLDAGGDPLTQLTFQILKQHQGSGERLLPSVAEAMARQQLGMAPINAATAAPAQEPAQTTQAPATPSAVDEMQSQLQVLNAELKTALNDFDPGKQADVQQRINDLNRQIVKEELRAEMEERIEAQRAAELSAAHEAALAASRAAVAAQYGDQYQPGSPLTLMMMGVFDSWQSANDPRMNDPRLPELIAKEAASKLAFQPKTEQAPVAAVTAATAVQQTSAPLAQPRSNPQVAPPIAPGTARSQDPGPITPPNFSNMNEYTDWVQKNLGVSAL